MQVDSRAPRITANGQRKLDTHANTHSCTVTYLTLLQRLFGGQLWQVKMWACLHTGPSTINIFTRVMDWMILSNVKDVACNHKPTENHYPTCSSLLCSFIASLRSMFWFLQPFALINAISLGLEKALINPLYTSWPAPNEKQTRVNK